MSAGAPDSLTSIATHVQDCLGTFDDVCASLAKADVRIRNKIPPGTIHDCLGRFRLWVGNIGAHRKGRSSLDYKLREASHIRDRVIELLQNLKAVLREALEIITGERVPWEDLPDSDSEGSEADFDRPDEEPTTELAQLASNMSEVNSCLMRLSLAIRNPAPHDQFKESSQIDVTHYEKFDVDHVRGKFPRATEYLVHRLGKAISRRRQYLRYREEHRKKLERGLQPQPQPIVSKEVTSQRQAPTVTAPSEKIESTVASSIPLAIKASTSTVNLDEEDLYEDTLSQTSYASSNNDLARLRPPPLPVGGQDGDPFECPLCFRFTSVRQTSAWHKHVYRDLQPYVCTFDECKIPDRTYESRHEWFQHELQAHRKWWECVDGCNQTFHSTEKFRKHLRDHHRELADERSSDLLRNCERQQSLNSHAQCQLCFLELPSLVQLRRHLGKHHEELSLFALPSHMKDDDEEIDDDRSDDSPGSSVAGSNDSTGQSHLICELCNLEFRGTLTKTREELDLHMYKVHGHLGDRISNLSHDDPEFVKASQLLIEDPSTAQGLDDRPFNRSLLARPIVQQLPTDIISWSDLTRHFRDILRAKDSIFWELRTLQAVQCGNTLTETEFAGYLARLPKNREDGLPLYVPSVEMIFRVDGRDLKALDVLAALNNLGSLHVRDEDTYRWQDVGYALPHRARLSSTAVESIKTIYRQFAVHLNPEQQEADPTWLHAPVILLANNRKFPGTIAGKLGLLDSGWVFLVDPNLDGFGQLFRIPFEDVKKLVAPQDISIALKADLHGTLAGDSEVVIRLQEHPLELQFSNSGDLVIAYEHAYRRIPLQLHGLKMSPANGLALQRRLCNHNLRDISIAIRDANVFTNIDVSWPVLGEAFVMRETSMHYDPTGFTFFGREADTSGPVQRMLWIPWESLLGLSVVTGLQLQLEVDDMTLKRQFDTEGKLMALPKVMGSALLSVTASSANDMAVLRDFLWANIHRARDTRAAGSERSAEEEEQEQRRDEAHFSTTRIGSDVGDEEHVTRDQTTGADGAFPGLQMSAETDEKRLAIVRRAPSPPGEDLEDIAHSSSQIHDDDESSVVEDATSQDMQTTNDFRCDIRLLDFDPTTATLTVHVNGVLTIAKHNTANEGRVWSTYYQDLRDYAFTDDIITLFGLQNLLYTPIIAEDLRIMATDPKETAKLKAWVLHHMDARRSAGFGTVVDSAGAGGGHKISHNGKEYDYVFDVDIEDGKPPLKLTYNVKQTHHEAARKFIEDNELPLSYLYQIANFIIQNTRGLEARYRPGVANEVAHAQHQGETSESVEAAASQSVVGLHDSSGSSQAQARPASLTEDEVRADIVRYPYSIMPGFQVVARHSEWFGDTSRDWAPISGKLAIDGLRMVMVASGPLLMIEFEDVHSVKLGGAKNVRVRQDLGNTIFEAETVEDAQSILLKIREGLTSLRSNTKEAEETDEVTKKPYSARNSEIGGEVLDTSHSIEEQSPEPRSPQSDAIEAKQTTNPESGPGSQGDSDDERRSKNADTGPNDAPDAQEGSIGINIQPDQAPLEEDEELDNLLANWSPVTAPAPIPIKITIRGHEYDITDLGLDTEYLDALPEELREEVLITVIAERQAELRERAEAGNTTTGSEATRAPSGRAVIDDGVTSQTQISDLNADEASIHRSFEDFRKPFEVRIPNATLGIPSIMKDDDAFTNPGGSETDLQRAGPKIETGSPDRWAQIRAQAADRAGRLDDERAQGHRGSSRSPTQATDNDAASGEGNIESRVARIKKRVVDLTESAAPDTKDIPDPTANGGYLDSIYDEKVAWNSHRPRDDIVEQRFEAIIQKQGWDQLPEASRKAMKAYDCNHKWALVRHIEMYGVTHEEVAKANLEHLAFKEVQVMETSSRVLGEEHPYTLTSMANLALTYRNQGRWKEAEELEVQVMERRKRILGEEYPSTLTSMANLALTYRNQGRWKEAEELEVQVMASTYKNQGRWKISGPRLENTQVGSEPSDGDETDRLQGHGVDSGKTPVIQQEGPEIEKVAEAYAHGAGVMRSDASQRFRDKLQLRLIAKLADSAETALQANLTQGEAGRQAAAKMTLDAKKKALQDAVDHTVVNSGASFKQAARDDQDTKRSPEQARTDSDELSEQHPSTVEMGAGSAQGAKAPFAKKGPKLELVGPDQDKRDGLKKGFSSERDLHIQKEGKVWWICCKCRRTNVDHQSDVQRDERICGSDECRHALSNCADCEVIPSAETSVTTAKYEEGLGGPEKEVRYREPLVVRAKTNKELDKKLDAIAPSAPAPVMQKVHETVVSKLGKTMGYGEDDIQEALARDEPSAIKDAYLIVRETEMVNVNALMNQESHPSISSPRPRQDKQNEALVHPEKAKKLGQRTMLQSLPPRYTKIHRNHLDVETLHYYDIPYEYDDDPSYIIVLREMSQRETEVLFEHSRRLRSHRSGRLFIEAEGRDKSRKKEYSFVRKSSRSRSQSNMRREDRKKVVEPSEGSAVIDADTVQLQDIAKEPVKLSNVLRPKTVDVTNVKRAQGSKKKKKSENDPWPVDDIDLNKKYCICDSVSYGRMISCDNKCDREWFHFPCVKMTEADTSSCSRWYCPECRLQLGVDPYGNPLVPSHDPASHPEPHPTTVVPQDTSDIMAVVSTTSSPEVTVNTPSPEAEYSIFVGDLAPDVNEYMLLQLFENKYQSTESARIMSDPISGVSRGYGFVRFTSEDDRRRALIEMDGVYCGNRPMRTGIAISGTKRSGPIIENTQVGDEPSDGDQTDRVRDDDPEVIDCSYCGFRFSGKYRRENLAHHMRQRHPNKIPERQQCEAEGCSRSFLRKDARLNHYRNSHPHLVLVGGPGPDDGGLGGDRTQPDGPHGGNSHDTSGIHQEGLKTEKVAETYVHGVGQLGSDAYQSFRDKLQLDLKAALGDSAAALQANLAQGEADRQASAQMALDAKKNVLQDALKGIKRRPRPHFGHVCCQCGRKFPGYRDQCPYDDCKHERTECSDCMNRDLDAAVAALAHQNAQPLPEHAGPDGTELSERGNSSFDVGEGSTQSAKPTLLRESASAALAHDAFMQQAETSSVTKQYEEELSGPEEREEEHEPLTKETRPIEALEPSHALPGVWAEEERNRDAAEPTHRRTRCQRCGGRFGYNGIVHRSGCPLDV